MFQIFPDCDSETKSDSDVILCLQLLSKTFTCTLRCESIDKLSIIPILRKNSDFHTADEKNRTEPLIVTAINSRWR